MLLPFLLACAEPEPAGDDPELADPQDSAEPDPVGPDVVLILDDSASMRGELFQVAKAAAALLVRDARVAVTSTSVAFANGAGPGIDPGEAGVPYADPTDDLATLQATILCKAIPWGGNVMNDPGYIVGTPLEQFDEESVQLLDDHCGVGAWRTAEGAGAEEGLEAALDFACRTTEGAPAACESAEIMPPGDLGVLAKVRRGGPVRYVVVSDEGDRSRRLETEDNSADLYVALLDDTLDTWTFNVIGPAYQARQEQCLGDADAWGVERYQAAVTATAGLYLPLENLADGCAPTDIAAALAAVASGF
jgi:hypothetical protein